ncbi:MAG: DUF2079 domain-containing protein, partial [Candidatus Velthaea sp.]
MTAASRLLEEQGIEYRPGFQHGMAEDAVIAAEASSSARARRSLLLWSATAFVVLCALDVARAALWTYGADTGTFAQIVLDAFGGMRNGIEHGTHYRYHWSPALAVLWPFVAATHSALALQFVQAAATVAAAPLVYALVAPRAGADVALRAAILTLLYPPLVAVGWGEFHEIGLFPMLALGALVTADRRCWGWFAVCVAAAAGLREDVCIEFILAGAALGIARWRSRRAWFAAAAAAAASLALYYAVVLPRAGGRWIPAHFYTYAFASGPLTLLAAPVTHPREAARALLTFGRFTYV